MGLLLFCILIYFIGGLGASMGYHRVLAHRSATMPAYVEYLIICLGLPAGTPIQWAGNHRAHHFYTDRIGDPHSPIKDGFWYAHCGWYIQSKKKLVCFLYAIAGPIRMLIDGVMRPLTNQQNNHLADDIKAITFYRVLSKPIVYLIFLWTYCFILVFISIYFWKLQGLIALWLTLVIVYNLGDSVDSIGHLIGKKEGVSHARNNLILGIFCFGDGWHSNHHIHPRNARHGFGIKQPDLTFLFLIVLKKIGIISKLQEYEKSKKGGS